MESTDIKIGQTLYVSIPDSPVYGKQALVLNDGNNASGMNKLFVIMSGANRDDLFEVQYLDPADNEEFGAEMYHSSELSAEEPPAIEDPESIPGFKVGDMVVIQAGMGHEDKHGVVVGFGSGIRVPAAVKSFFEEGAFDAGFLKIDVPGIDPDGEPYGVQHAPACAVTLADA